LPFLLLLVPKLSGFLKLFNPFVLYPKGHVIVHITFPPIFKGEKYKSPFGMFSLPRAGKGRFRGIFPNGF